MQQTIRDLRYIITRRLGRKITQAGIEENILLRLKFYSYRSPANSVNEAIAQEIRDTEGLWNR